MRSRAVMALLAALLLASSRLSADPAISPSTAFTLVARWELPAAGAPFEPVDIALAPDGLAFVADGHTNSILGYDATGTLVAQWVAHGERSDCGGLVPRAVTVDGPRGHVFSLWACWPTDELHSLPRELGLDKRTLDGQSLLPWVTNVGLGPEPVNVPDLEVHWPTGALAIARSNSIRFLDIPMKGWSLPLLKRPFERIAVTFDGTGIVSVSPDEGVVDLYSVDGVRRWRTELHDLEPLAPATDDSGEIHVLVRPRSGQPNAPLVITLDSEGQQTNSIAAPQGVPYPPDSDWPWALASYGDTLALTTADDVFQVVRLRSGLLSDPPLLGSRVIDRAEPHHGTTTARHRGSVSLSLNSYGRLVALDQTTNRIIWFDALGNVSRTLSVGPVLDIAFGHDDSAYVVSESGEVRKLSLGSGSGDAWESRCNCSLASRLSVGVLLLRN